MTILWVTFLLLLFALAYALPALTRPDVFFAVTVDPAFRRGAPAGRIVRRYRAILCLSTAAAIGALLASGFLEGMLVQLAGFGVALALAHRETLAYAAPPSGIVEVDLAAPPERLPGGPLVALAPATSLLLLALWVRRHWEQLPARIPVHWGFRGADRWIARTSPGVDGFIALHLALSLLFAAFAWGILQLSRHISAGGEAALRDRRFRRLSVQMLLLTAYFPAVLAWSVLLNQGAAGLCCGLALLGVIGGYLAALIRANRLPVPAVLGDRTPDSCWKLGMIYFNPADPSLFVAKRFGVGYTVNLGNRWSWAILGTLTALAVTGALLR